jgi:PAS domain S-box-containing protein
MHRNSCAQSALGTVLESKSECKHSQKHLELIFENSLDAILLISPSDGGIFIANPAACKMFGMTEDELRQAGRKGVMVTDDAALAALEQRNQEGKVFTELTYKRKDGSTFCGELASKTFIDADGIVKASVIIRDVTEHRKTEEALRENKDRLELAQYIADLGSWEFDVKKGQAIWSKQLYEMFELNPETKAPNIPEYQKLIHSDYLKMAIEYGEKLQSSGKLGETQSYDYAIVTPQNTTKFIHTVRRVTEVDENEKPSRIMGIEQDITARKNIERRLEQYSKGLEALVEERTNELKEKERLAAIGETAGMIGHDIRNPLQAIVSELYMARQAMQKGAMGAEEAVESIDFVQEQVDYITKIVQDLQDYARPLKPEFQEANLSDILVNVFSTIAIPSTIRLNLQVKGSLKAKADPTFMKRALTNLFNNAIQAMPGGGELTVKAYENEKSIVIKVGDTGVGISDNVKPSIFKPLMSTKAKGQGLGLAVVKRLIEALGGQVSFESQEGKGTTFIIELPQNGR